MDGPRTSLRRSRRLPWLALGVALAGAYGVYWLRHGGGAPTPRATVAAAPAPEPSQATTVHAEEQVDAAGAGALLEGVSTSALARRWLAEADVVRRCAILADNVAEGVSPRKLLRALAPAAPFSVSRGEDGFVIASASYSRYDGVAGAIESIDAGAAAIAYRRLHVALETAYRALGHPDGSLDRAVSRALARIEKAPVVEGGIRVVPEDGSWAFADGGLERLGEVEKHLLRMGPRNTRILQSKARELREALQLPEQVASGTR